jgi:predicted NBD/HSP70 family sugar kinase
VKGDQQTSRALNRRLVLNLLRREAPKSRAELAAGTGLSGATVTFVVNELIEEGLVRERETIKGTGGRRPVPLELNYASRLVIGLKLNFHGIEAVLTDLSTTLLDSVFEPLPDTEPETVVAHAAAAVRQLAARPLIMGRPVVGIGFSLPGCYDVERGICTTLPRFGWENIPIAEMLAREVALPVWVDNDVNAFALAQHLFGAGKNYDTLLAVGIGTGVGAALVSKGRLHYGASYLAGEIGHTIVVPAGRACDCGRKGCLQTYTSEAALKSDWKTYRAGAPDALADLGEAAEAGEPAALDLLTSAGEALGASMALLVDLVDPGVVVVGGEGVRFGEWFRKPLMHTLRERCFRSHPEVVFTWEQTSWLRGAAALAVQRYFNFETRDGMTVLRATG